MKFTQSLRWRMQFWHGLLLATALTGFGVLTFHYQKSSDLERIDTALEQQLFVVLTKVREESRPSRRPGRHRPPARGSRPRAMRAYLTTDEISDFLAANELDQDFLVMWQRDGTELGRVGDPAGEIARPEAPQGESQRFNVARTRGHMREVYRYLPPGECVLFGKSIENELAQWHRFGWQLAGSGITIMGLGLLGGWIFLSRSIRPINRISHAARQFAGGQLSERIPQEDVGGELGQLTTDLNETFNQLEEAFARQARFTADAAHELRTPVSVILSHAQAALAKERQAEAYKDSLQTCERGAKRLQGLIDSLLTLSSMDGADGTPVRRSMDLAQIAEQCMEFLQPLVQAHQLAVKSNLRSAACQGDPDQLHQVFMNLLTNALQFSPEGATIHLTTDLADGQAMAQVRDEGRGIAPEDLPHLFERFYRADPSRKRNGKRGRGAGAGGAGLGLAICQEIIEKHSGSIDVESELGVGTTVTFKIPVEGSPRQ